MLSDKVPAWPGETIIRLTYGHMLAQALHVATVLGVFDILEGGPKMAGEIAGSLSVPPGPLGRVLCLLVAADVLAAPRPDTYALAPAGATLTSSAPDSLRSRVLMRFDEASWRSWGELLLAVRTGEPSHPRVTGCTGFGYLARHPELQATFHAAMSAMTGRVAASFASAQDLSGARLITDVGGGNGRLLAETLRANPGARGILFDRHPAAVPADLAGLDGRYTVLTGDFFESVPAGADVYLLKSVVHDWPDERAVQILSRCRHAMGPAGRLLLIELVLPVLARPGEDLETLCTDLNMLVITGGRERTGPEFAALLRAAGLEMAAVGPPLGATPYRVIEARVIGTSAAVDS